jgi:5'-deoxynucleotidase YfbR-like HD superfamily hydrolase
MGKFAMASGKLIDIGNFTVDDVDLVDIAHHLSKIQRFNGALPIDITYSVAEHCINLVQHAMKVGGFSTLAMRMLLLHDAGEAYVSDVVSPAKSYIPDYVKLEKGVQQVINKKLLNINTLIDDSGRLKELDKRILIDEVQHIKPEFVDIYKQESGLDALECHIHFNNDPATVKACFLRLAKQLGIQRR